jgi:branched-chain amino acid transport system substrate-binding protein
MLSAKAAEMVIDAKKPLTGPNMAAALEGLKNWDTGGMLGTLVDIKDHKMAVGRVWQVDMKQGQPIKMVPISAVIKL